MGGGRSNGQERWRLSVSQECQAVKLGRRTAQLANTPGAGRREGEGGAEGGGSGVGDQGRARAPAARAGDIDRQEAQDGTKRWIVGALALRGHLREGTGEGEMRGIRA